MCVGFICNHILINYSNAPLFLYLDLEDECVVCDLQNHTSTHPRFINLHSFLQRYFLYTYNSMYYHLLYYQSRFFKFIEIENLYQSRIVKSQTHHSSTHLKSILCIITLYITLYSQYYRYF